MDYTGKTISIRTTFEEDFTGNNFLAMLKFFSDKQQVSISESSWDRLKILRKDKQGNKFLDKPLSLNALKKIIKDYNIELLFGPKDEQYYQVIMVSPGIIDLERSVNQIIVDLTDPNKMYLIFHSLIKNRNNMSFEEKLAYYKEKSRSEAKSLRGK
ncbi:MULTISPECIES: hypothetical protein [Streptococcus]|uniref:Uncharacterized protein n=1 Tax=Streptococcus parauberis KRS-02083 TaxID=1207545 RepID=A0ABN0IPS8_9STRE|nr:MULTISPECIES: hypothetical protein [Streptococcus]AUT05303.1 hypothetical protein SPSF3K_00563 [Streptococcus parauberis]EMG24810.1 hypothetical protein SPJ1_1681 [Streptococcus parauberis KRS-02083]MCK1158688.1 hypothetical protein [Streptococcus uberis]MCK1167699.1 hypothetical protein [Streptococcus uberis]MCK1189918.1 hypothetical protein [Streptococcus uberis]